MSKHTPTPWHVPDDMGGAFVCTGTPEDGYVIADCQGDPVHEENEANAARIVACVNNCADINPEAVPLLVEALKQAADALKDATNLMDWRGAHSPAERFFIVAEQARAALALAEKEPDE